MIRTFLVDDEQGARERLRHLLSSFGDVEIVGEAENGQEALQRIPDLRPDLVFLDIQMPGNSRLEVARALEPPRPRIIFCTAFDNYAISAFELHAIDYLLKPVNRTRLRDAVARVRQSVADVAARCQIEMAQDVPVRGSIPTDCAKRNTIWAGVTWLRAARPATTGWRSTSGLAVNSEKPWYMMFLSLQNNRTSRSQPSRA